VVPESSRCGTEREREREREREFKYMGMLRGRLLYNPERERDGKRAREGRRRFTRKRVSEAALVREREGSLGSRKEKSSTPET
jgi:hypothetical protein